MAVNESERNSSIFKFYFYFFLFCFYLGVGPLDAMALFGVVGKLVLLRTLGVVGVSGVRRTTFFEELGVSGLTPG